MYEFFEPLLVTASAGILGWSIWTIATKGKKTMSYNGSILANGGGFTLFDARGNFVQAYSRRRDAVRGANRKGIAIV